VAAAHPPDAFWVGGQDAPASAPITASARSIDPEPADLVPRRRRRGLPAGALRARPRAALPDAWSYAIPLVGLAATPPWLAFPERTIFQFYTVVMAPFLILALVLALRAARRTQRSSPSAPVRTAHGLVIVVLIVLVSAFWYPLWIGLPVPWWFWQAHNWMITWI
jgi:dolichyl-phosphate-mannose--protein O-mannosyl transferase